MNSSVPYRICLSNEDVEELQALESQLKCLMRRSFELECKLFMPEPRKFEEIDAVAQPSITCVKRKEWDLSNGETKMHINKQYGIFVTDIENGMTVCFRTSHSDGYFVCLKEEDCFVLDKYHLPPIVPIRELCDNLTSGKRELHRFCHKVYHFIMVFEDRLRQIHAVKMSRYFEKIEFFSSHSTEYVKVGIPKADTANAHEICVHLYYQADFTYPQKMNVDCPGMKNEEKLKLVERCQVFLVMPLLDSIVLAFF
ncbi:uncharacterized protein [Hetaerina americana]|uniref:uncharacterized protein n=1 Tax=Hetaerina americana TaxID=62018 RepID=UPI003A7F49FD